MLTAEIYAHPVLLDDFGKAIVRASELGMVAMQRGNSVIFAKPLKQSDVSWQNEWLGIEGDAA